MIVLLKNISSLLQIDDEELSYRAGKSMMEVHKINDAFLLIEDGVISDYGSMKDLPKDAEFQATKVRDLQNKMVFPAFNDSHTHLVYAGSREIEYINKVKGLSYEEIAKKGGGILNSANLLHNTSEDELYRQSVPRILEIMSQGTAAVEIKSGYGLNTEDELKMLRVIRRIRENFPLIVKSTFLGAHAVPAEYKSRQSEYVDKIINEMIPVVASEELAEYIDVFCDEGFFSMEDTDRILNAGLKYGLRPKIHANELAFSGGIQTGVKYNALSVDHLEFTGEQEIEVLKNSETMPTILPGASLFLEMRYAPARLMIDSGLPVALASDFNPGSSPSGNMKLIMSLALIKLHMLPEEILNAVTLNSAYAMGISDVTGTISRGKLANLIITKPIPGFEYFPYAYGSDLISDVLINGVSVK
ncbi:MAG: imidazolonepropionase [Bacteroidales bacterium]|nr:imidazolonepropionase [Bacteroidales bacterium]